MNNEKISKTLIALRGSQSQCQVATALGISASALSMYERGERIPRDNIKEKIARYYGKEVGQIFYA